MKVFSCLLLSSTLTAVAAPLTLDEALARTATGHPRLLAQDAREDAAAALAEQAALRPNPELSVTLENFAGTGRARDLASLEGTLEISQALERGGKRARRAAAAGQDRAVAAAEAGVIRAGILAATAEAYVAAVAAARQARLAEDFVALARTALADAEKRHAAGDASAAEPARARAALADAEAVAARLADAWHTACATLAAAWDGDAHEAAPAATAFTLPPSAPDPAVWLAQLDSHPLRQLAEARARAAEARAGLEEANATQDLRVGAGVRYLRENSDAALVAGVSVPLPVRHRNQGAIRAARQEAAGATHEVAAVTRELRASVATAARELAAAHAAALRLRREVLPAAAEAAALLRRAYAAGQTAQFEVLEAERALREVQRETLAWETAYALALVRAEARLDPALPLTRQLLSTP